MPVVNVTVHPDGLHPFAAVKAWHKNMEEGFSIDQIIAEGEVLALNGSAPGRKAVWAGIRRVNDMGQADLVPKTRYENCGRKRSLTDREEAQVIEFVKRWRHKAFCTCRYIRQELGLAAAPRTINRLLNDHGYYWRTVPKIQGLSKEQLLKRKAFVDTYLDRSPAWWQQRMQMVLDGVTLTTAPKPLSSRQKHAAQRITSM